MLQAVVHEAGQSVERTSSVLRLNSTGRWQKTLLAKMNGAPDADIAVFTEALRLPPEERDRYLDKACKADVEFRRRVEALLQAYEQAGDFLGKSAADRPARAAQTSPAGEKPGDRIGHYKLLQQIGEGGCGVVYMAEQVEPVRRRVALKIIKPGMDTKQVIVRFEAERQALALMDHPNIARVLAAGTQNPSPKSERRNPQDEGAPPVSS